jgi:predicted AlkP superfamily pyrophosphatase or phosphodiesterase
MINTSKLKITVLFTVLLIAGFKLCASNQLKNTNDQPTVIVISIDGFKNDYLDHLSVPNLQHLIKTGVHAPLISVFPSSTFPNHVSIATGLYPEHHGIMLNEFLAFDIKEPFGHIGHDPKVSSSNWWLGEPIWVTAQKQGQVTASIDWPGAEYVIKDRKPSYIRRFVEDGNPDDRVKATLQYLKLPAKTRPRLIMLYFENVDNAGHEFGPDSKQVRVAATRVDNAIGKLIEGLKAQGIFSSTDLIIVSDHGMTDIDNTKIINLRKFVFRQDLVAVTGEGTVVGVYPKTGRLHRVYHALKSSHEPIDIYLSSKMPEDLHYSNAKRTPPIVVVAKEHAFILGSSNKVEKGAHGYNPTLASMKGIFIASGPAFKSDYEKTAFRNIHLYSLIAYLLDLKPTQNDGSLVAVKNVLR